MGLREQIEVKLAATFAPVSLLVQDDSAQHAGHSGAREGGETHFSVTIVSAAFCREKPDRDAPDGERGFGRRVSCRGSCLGDQGECAAGL